MKKLSVILPVFNTERYLKRAIDSILHSTLKNDIEIIVVDDHSPGNCYEIVKGYSSISIKYIKHPYNKGLFQSRYTGILNASGEFVTHLDSDDWINKDIYETAYTLAKKNHQDIVLFNMINVENKNHSYIKENEKIYPFKNKCGQELIDEIFLCNTNRWTIHACWNKIIKKDIAKEALKYLCEIKHLNLAEDLLWSTTLFLILKNKYSISAIEDIGLNYYIHENAITKKLTFKSFKKNVDDTILVYKEINKLFEKFNLDKEYFTYLIRTNSYVINCLFKKYPLFYKFFRLSVFNKFTILYNKKKIEELVINKCTNIVIKKILNLKCSNVYIYGIGRMAMHIKKQLDSYNIVVNAFIVSEKGDKEYFQETPIMDINELKNTKEGNIVIASIGSFHPIEQTIKNVINTPSIIGVFKSHE